MVDDFVTTARPCIFVEVFDSSPGGDLIGAVNIELKPVFQSGQCDQWFPVCNKTGKHSGDIHVTVRFTAAPTASKGLGYAPNPYAQPPNHYGAAPVQQYAAAPGYPPAAFGGDTLAAARVFPCAPLRYAIADTSSHEQQTPLYIRPTRRLISAPAPTEQCRQRPRVTPLRHTALRQVTCKTCIIVAHAVLARLTLSVSALAAPGATPYAASNA